MRPVPPLPTPLAERPWPGEWSRGIIRAERVDRATVVLSLVGEFDLSTYEPASEVGVLPPFPTGGRSGSLPLQPSCDTRAPRRRRA